MNSLKRLLGALPPPYAVADDALLVRLLDVFALEMDALSEDVDRVRQTHWIDTVYRLEELDKLAALLNVRRFSWETLPTLRARLKALVQARLSGALGVREIRHFVYDYLTRVEEVLACVFLPGLSRPGTTRLDADQAYGVPEERPRYRPLELVENPEKLRRSNTLLARGGRVPYLFRWEESNRGLAPTRATFRVVGYSEGRTAVPILVNRTTGDLIGYRGTVPLGRALSIEAGGADGAAKALLEGEDVSEKLFSMEGFRLGTPFEPSDLDASPRLPRLARGENAWIYLSVGLFDVAGLSRFFYAIAGEELREGVFDATFFNQALFPSGAVAKLEMSWLETEPASFEVRVPRYLVAEPTDATDVSSARPYQQFEEGLRESIGELHAAGVRAEVKFVPFQETLRQHVRLRPSWVVLPPGRGPAGEGSSMELGGRFGETGLGSSRYN
jgi:hypothetical protein